jgi:hypothetical protein
MLVLLLQDLKYYKFWILECFAYFDFEMPFICYKDLIIVTSTELAYEVTKPQRDHCELLSSIARCFLGLKL